MARLRLAFLAGAMAPTARAAAPVPAPGGLGPRGALCGAPAHLSAALRRPPRERQPSVPSIDALSGAPYHSMVSIGRRQYWDLTWKTLAARRVGWLARQA